MERIAISRITDSSTLAPRRGHLLPRPQNPPAHPLGNLSFPGADSDVYGNYLANSHDDAIETEGGNQNVRIWNNYIGNSYVGLANAATSIGPLYVWRNVSGAIGLYSVKMGYASNPVFGATSSNLLQSNDAGRPKYETRTLPILDVLTSTASYPYPPLSLNRLATKETLILTSGTAILQSPTAGVAGAINSYGAGKAVQLALLPGLTYINDAVRGGAYDVDSFMPQNYRAEVAQLIAWPAVLATIKQVNQPTPSAPLATVTRWDSSTALAPARSVLFVIDYSGVPKPGYSVTIPDAQHFTNVGLPGGPL